MKYLALLLLVILASCENLKLPDDNISSEPSYNVEVDAMINKVMDKDTPEIDRYVNLFDDSVIVLKYPDIWINRVITPKRDFKSLGVTKYSVTKKDGTFLFIDPLTGKERDRVSPQTIHRINSIK